MAERGPNEVTQMNLMILFGMLAAVVILAAVYGARLNASTERSAESIKDLGQRLARLEDRMANLETIVLEKEKSDKYERL